MITLSLQSGSNGNCYYYQSGDVKLLFDAGIPWRCAAERMRVSQLDSTGISGIFISHDHSDHYSGAGVFHRKTGAPLFMTLGTYNSTHRQLGKIKRPEFFSAGDAVKVGHVTVETIGTPHDAAEPVVFVISDGETRVGILTDLGHCFKALLECLHDLDVVFLESNYDERMLTVGGYPEHLKARIRGPHGHLENSESAQALRTHRSKRLKAVYLSHLSGENNTPKVAMSAHATKDNTRLMLAPRHGPSQVLCL